MAAEIFTTMARHLESSKLTLEADDRGSGKSVKYYKEQYGLEVDETQPKSSLVPMTGMKF
jgi:hypothetical protein